MDQSLAELIPRMLVSMGVVVAVMWIAARLLRGKNVPGAGVIGKRSRPKVDLDVIARQGVGRHASINVVRVGDKTLVLGITEQNISLLTELESIDLDTAEIEHLLSSQRTGSSADTLAGAGVSGSTWTGLLTQIRERTVRKS